MTIDMWFDELDEALWWYRALGGTLKKVDSRYLLICEE